MFLSVLVAVPVHADENDEADSIEDRAMLALWWGDFAELERLYDKAKRSSSRTASGRVELALFRRGISRALNGSDNDAAIYFSQVESLTRQWVAEHPRSPLAHLLYARSLYARAWNYRGAGYASKVSPQAWADFRKYIRMAEEHLSCHSSVVISDSTTHIYLLMLGRSSGWSREQMWGIAQDGLRRNPDDDGIYEEMLFSLLPKWGGNAEAMDRVIQDAVERTKNARGLEMYARLYHFVATDISAELFTQTKADWKKVKAGFDDFVARHPHPLNLNAFAFLACLAQDKPVAADMLKQIGDSPLIKQWGGGSSGRAHYESCKRWVRSE